MSMASGREGRGRPDRAVALAVLAFAAVTYAHTYWFDEVPAALMGGLGAELFPRLVLGVLAFLCVLLFFNIGSPPMQAPAPIPREAWITGAALCLFMAGVELVGMWPSCFAALVGIGRLWGERSLLKLGASAVILTGALYLVFGRLLTIAFPRSMLGALIWP